MPTKSSCFKIQTQIYPETLSKSAAAVCSPSTPTSALLHHVQETSQDLCLAPSESSGLNVTLTDGEQRKEESNPGTVGEQKSLLFFEQ